MGNLEYVFLFSLIREGAFFLRARHCFLCSGTSSAENKVKEATKIKKGKENKKAERVDREIESEKREVPFLSLFFPLHRNRASWATGKEAFRSAHERDAAATRVADVDREGRPCVL